MIGFTDQVKRAYRIEREAGAEHGDPFGDIIPARYGHVYVHGDGLYGAATNGRGMARRVASLGRIVADADDGVNVVFPAARLPAVARLIGARRRRRLSPEQREAKAEILVRARANRGANASEGVKSTQNTSAA
jgi:hypothetical protein